MVSVTTIQLPSDFIYGCGNLNGIKLSHIIQYSSSFIFPTIKNYKNHFLLAACAIVYGPRSSNQKTLASIPKQPQARLLRPQTVSPEEDSSLLNISSFLLFSYNMKNNFTKRPHCAKCCKGGRLPFDASNSCRGARSKFMESWGHCLLTLPTYPSNPVCLLTRASSHSISFFLRPQISSPTWIPRQLLETDLSRNWDSRRVFFKYTQINIGKHTMWLSPFCGLSLPPFYQNYVHLWPLKLIFLSYCKLKRGHQQGFLQCMEMRI